MSATGNIAHDDAQALKLHLEECASCRGMYADMAEIHAKWLPERPGFEIHRDRAADLRHRDAILNTLTKQGARFSRAARNSPASVPSSSLTKRGWIPVAVGAAMFVLGAVLTGQVWLGETAVAPPVATVSVTAPVVSQMPSLSGDREAALQQQIEAARAAQARLQQELVVVRHRSASLQQSNTEASFLSRQLEQDWKAARVAQRTAEAQLAEFRQKQETADTIALLQEAEIERLNKKLSDQAAAFERERRILSLGGREVRDLIAARNLHIIDVYDTDARGKDRPAFGRIFYTEAKSLIFYAYDLNGTRSDDGNTTYHVWGKRDGAPQDIKSLGTFAEDDHSRKRWVFSTRDTNILASIDSVFVTIERNGDPATRPSGKSLLNAYLDTAANLP